jgi:hypothetical protein
MYKLYSMFVWLVADGWCWFLLREKYCWLVASGWFVLREKYCWLVADKPSEQGVEARARTHSMLHQLQKLHAILSSNSVFHAKANC